jgi:hypothetical protein
MCLLGSPLCFLWSWVCRRRGRLAVQAGILVFWFAVVDHLGLSFRCVCWVGLWAFFGLGFAVVEAASLFRRASWFAFDVFVGFAFVFSLVLGLPS